jgi:outer membrane protein assembly factor BamA
MTASDFSYVRLVGDITDYHTFTRGLVMAARLRHGWARALGGQDSTLGVHPQKRFFAGGPNSIRGYAQYRLGPKLLTIDAAGRLARPVAENGAGCAAQSINDGSCDVQPLAEDMPDVFEVRPVGGAALLEGNVELRFPVYGDQLRGAAFLDFGQVWSTVRQIGFDDLVWTPGFGVRYFSAIGPIRIDIGYNAESAERVTVVTTEVRYCPTTVEEECEPIQDGIEYPFDKLDNTRTLRSLGEVLWNPRRSFFDRLQFHFSIGQAF